ncbi:MAG: hypothetical protein ABH885_06410 [Candidatus Omnitrophota bacterium]
MKFVFVLHDRNDTEILDARDNVERARRMRCINDKRCGSREGCGAAEDTAVFQNRRPSFKRR